MRRAISWEYWPPKSRTSTSSVAGRAPTPSVMTISGSAPGALRSGTWTRSALSFVAAAARWASVIRDRYSGVHRGAAIGAHADVLLVLELLALGLEGRRHHHLGPVELGDVGVAAGRHRRPQRAHQVEGPVVLLGGAEQDLLERPILLGRDAGASGQRGMEGRHAPVV